MTTVRANSFPLVAVDVGNSRVKLGLFESQPAAGALPVPGRSSTIGAELNQGELETWFAPTYLAHPWIIASVQRKTAARLAEFLKQRGATAVRFLQSQDLPLRLDVPRPERVGIDRLVNAVAANRLREPHRAAIVISVGSAITVNAINEHGIFLGGAILPGIGMSARALHEFTDLLPLSEMTELHDAPEPLGQDTTSALQSGLFWGAVGAMRELASRIGAQLPHPHVFLTGGAAPSVSEFLVDATGTPAVYVPHLTLAGIALSALA